MRELTLQRKITSDQGTFGRLSGEGLSLFSAELPWRDNLQSISCIPAGAYECVPYTSTKYPDAFLLKDVPGRSAILIHSGNWVGDFLRGFRSDSNGCILVGTGAGELMGQQAVTGSKDAMDALRIWAAGKGFRLIVRDI